MGIVYIDGKERFLVEESLADTIAQSANKDAARAAISSYLTTNNIDPATYVFSAEEKNALYGMSPVGGHIVGQVVQQVIEAIKFQAFGHSLIHHNFNNEPPLNFVFTDYTSAGVWLGLIAAENSKGSVGSYTFGQLADHNALAWPNPAITGAFDNGNTSAFSGGYNNQDYTHHIMMPSNYLEDEFYAPPFNNSVAVTQGRMETLIDNIDGEYATSEKLIYVHQHEANVNSMSRAVFTSYNNEIINELMDWHIDLQNAINTNGRTVRLIPVGPVVAYLLENEAYLQSLDFQDLYADGAPHPSESISFLYGLVMYRVMFRENPNLDNFTFPAGATQMNAAITGNVSSIISAIDSRLTYLDNNGANVY